MALDVYGIAHLFKHI